MLLNDGRFRVGGSTGYVLKPEYLCTNKPGVDIDDSLNCCNPKKITVLVLSGSCLPKSLDKKSSFASYNPFVRVTLYDGSPGGTNMNIVVFCHPTRATNLTLSTCNSSDTSPFTFIQYSCGKRQRIEPSLVR